MVEDGVLHSIFHLLQPFLSLPLLSSFFWEHHLFMSHAELSCFDTNQPSYSVGLSCLISSTESI